ncbi:MAG: hypothetical protein ACON5F_02325 [Jejuia sp.]
MRFAITQWSNARLNFRFFKELFSQYRFKTNLILLVFGFSLCLFHKAEAQITSYPYVEDFENGDGGWTVHGDITSWEWGFYSSDSNINNAWATNLDGSTLENENGWIQSPTFDFTNLELPKVEFFIDFDTSSYDYIGFYYSLDDGSSWTIVEGWPYNLEMSFKNYYLIHLQGEEKVTFRFLFTSSDILLANGAAIDLFKVYDDTTSTTYVPDSEFQRYLSESGINVNNGNVLTYDIANLTELDIEGYDIANFTGLENFFSLINISITDNLSTVPHDIEIIRNNSKLNTISIVNAPFLKNLVFKNDFSRPFFSEFNSLKTLNIETNGDLLTKIELPSTLVSVNISNNAINELNLQYNESIKYLNVGNNPLDELHLNSLVNLETLGVYNTNLEYLDISNNNKLNYIVANNNSSLKQLNLKNTTTNLISFLDASYNELLSCIQVDDVNYALSNSSWDITNTPATYSDNCDYKVASYPYYEDFESDDGGWKVVNQQNSSWNLGTPNSTNLKSAASGTMAWCTNLIGSYNDNENGWVESPVFDFSEISLPNYYNTLYIQFNIWYNNQANNDGAVLQSSIDSGTTWQNLGGMESSSNVNGYTSNSITSSPGGQMLGWTGTSANVHSNNWKTVFIPISNLIGESNVIFRFVFSSNDDIVSDGFAFDMVSITNKEFYAGEDSTSELICAYNEETDNVLTLDSFISQGVDRYLGNWTSTDEIEINKNIIIDGVSYSSGVRFQDIPSSGSFEFKYIVPSNENPTFFDESIVILNFEKRVLDSEYYDYGEGCSELTFDTDDDFQQWAFQKHVVENNSILTDSGGTWFPSSFEGYGYYEYSQLPTTTCSDSLSYFLYSDKPVEVQFKTIRTFGFYTNLYDLLDPLYNEGKVKRRKRRSRIRSRNLDIQDNGGVNFPNSGLDIGQENTFSFTYEVFGDCGNLESVTKYTIISASAGGGGSNNVLYVCDDGLIEEDFPIINEIGEEEYYSEYMFKNFGSQLNNALGHASEYGFYYEGNDVFQNYYSVWDQQSTLKGGKITLVKVPMLLKLSIYLEGAYDYKKGIMNNYLWKDYNFRLNENISPYEDSLDKYSPPFDSVGGAYENEVVDWVWIELRDENDINNVVYSRSALLMRSGEIADLNHLHGIRVDVEPGNYYVMVSHRNHLGIITAEPQYIDCGTELDFRYDSTLVMGKTNGIKDMEDGSFALYAGDFNGDGQIQITDKTEAEKLRGASGYSNADFDLNGEAQNTDINEILIPNLGRGEQLISKKLNDKRKE